MTEIRFLITAKDCLFNHDMEFNFDEVVASPHLIERKIEEMHVESRDTLAKFGSVQFDFFAFCPDLFQAAMAFKLEVTNPVEYAKYKLKHPEDYKALIELASFYDTLKVIITRPNNGWIVMDREMNITLPFKQIH